MRPSLRLVVIAAIGCGSSTTPPSPPPTVPITNPAAPCEASITDVVVEAPPNPLARQLVVTLDAAAAVWAVCRPDADPDDALLFESGTAKEVHRIDVTGMYSGEWTCRVVTACRDADTETVALQPQVPGPVPTFSATGTPSGPWTILNTQKGAAADGRRDVVIVDGAGRVRFQTEVVSFQRADLDTSWTGEVVHIGGGWGLFETNIETRGLVRQLDLAGRVAYERLEPAFGEGYNHHSESLPDGEILSLTGTFHNVDGNRWNGIAVERLDPETETVTWSWDSHDLVDAGLEGPLRGNPWNGNALAWTTDGLGEALWISLYTGQAMWRIDPATGERTHVFGHDGDLVIVDAEGVPLPEREWVYGQHGPDFADDGRVLLYDNGVDRPGGDQSRVAEFRLDLQAGTATLLWQWTEDDWYTPIIGDADYLPGGHVLITKGVVRAFTPFRRQPSALIEVDPATDQVVWRLEPDDRPTPAIYRSQQYDGCALFR
ncbi:MAG: aryl-sulfate sulfotransferase, partial [Myxococcota bacterium]